MTTPVPPTVVDQAVAAAEGTRTAARWIASSLGAIPSLAVLASIVRTPGSGGFDPAKLALGVALAALGAVTGVLLFAWVIAPVPLEDKHLRTLKLTRIPGQPYTGFDELNGHLESVRAVAADKAHAIDGEIVDVKTTEAEALAAGRAAQDAEKRSAEFPGEAELKEKAQEARERASRLQSAAAEVAAAVAAHTEALTIWTTHLARLDEVRQDAYRLKAADVVRRRYLIARCGAVLSVALIASGVVLLGLAPVPAGHAGSAGPLMSARYQTQPADGVPAVVLTSRR